MRFLFVVLAIAAAVSTVAQRSFAADSYGESRTSSDFSSSRSYELNPVAGFSVFSAEGNQTNKNGLANTIGFVGGLLVDIPFTYESLRFETGGLFIQEGDAVHLSSYERTANYVGVPLLLKFRPTNGQVAPEIKGGLTPAVLVGAKTGYSTDATSDAYSSMTPFDIQATLGAGLGISTGTAKWIVADVTFMRGLVNFKRSGGALYNEGFMFTGGVVF